MGGMTVANKGAIFLSDRQYNLFLELLECIEEKINKLDIVNSNGGLPDDYDEGEVLKWQRMKSSEILAKCGHASVISN